MNNKNLSEMSDEALIKEEKSTRFLTGLLIGVLSASFVLGIVSVLKGGRYTFILTPVALLPIVIIVNNKLKDVRKEIKSRRNML